MFRNKSPGRNLILLICMLQMSVAQAGAPAAKSAADLVSEARGRITEIDPATAEEARAAGAVVLDVREPDEYSSGHVPGAVNVPRGVLEFRIDKLAAFNGLADDERREQPILVYCRSGKRAALATATLQQMGYGNARSIEGGFKAWQAEGLPVTDLEKRVNGERSEVRGER